MPYKYDQVREYIAQHDKRNPPARNNAVRPTRHKWLAHRRQMLISIEHEQRIENMREVGAAVGKVLGFTIFLISIPIRVLIFVCHNVHQLMMLAFLGMVLSIVCIVIDLISRIP